MDSTFEKIRGFLAEQLGVDASQITMDSDLLNDFEADSRRARASISRGRPPVRQSK